MKNILLIFSDQMRFDAIAAHGNPIVKTPALDALIADGKTFTRAYTPCPVCVPARFSMHNGVMPHTSGICENGPGLMHYNFPSFMEILSDNGYETFGAGKMHFTHGSKKDDIIMWGFSGRSSCLERRADGYDDFTSYLKKNGYGHVADTKGVRSEMYYIPQTSQLPEQHHHSHWVTDRSIDFLEKRDKDRPFFVMTSFEKPHPPFEPPVPWNKLYVGPSLLAPKRAEDDDGLLTLWNRYQNRYKYRDKGYDLNLVRQITAYYYSEVSFMDYNIGRLVKYLKDNGLYEDTLIVFSSDHGELLGDYGCYGKRCFLDSAARIPLIVKGGERGSDGRLASLIDILPTFLDYAGIKPGIEYEGLSLLKDEKRQSLTGQYSRGGGGVYMYMTEEYKYYYSVPDEKEYLTDLKRDPLETKNLAENSVYLKKTKEMREAAIGYFGETPAAAYALEDGKWKRYKKIDFDSYAKDAFLLFQDPVESWPDIEGYNDDLSMRKYNEFAWFDPEKE